MYRMFNKYMYNLLKPINCRMVLGKMNGLTTINKFDVDANRIVWLDMEMTGLDIEKDKIMEVACLLTDSDLNVISEGINLVIHQSEEILNNMDSWCINQHGSTGLTQACLNSMMSIEEAENVLYDYLHKHTTPQASPLAGNSVYMDKFFLLKYMPKVCSYLHYRIIDVSTIKELCRRWNPNVYKNIPKKEFTHRALQDIEESLQELKFYKYNFLNCHSK